MKTSLFQIMKILILILKILPQSLKTTQLKQIDPITLVHVPNLLQTYTLLLQLLMHTLPVMLLFII